jgi:hypothetical protein
MTNEERDVIVAEKVSQLRKDLAELGLESAFFYRAPGSAKAPVGYLLIGETSEDVEEARADRRP